MAFGKAPMPGMTNNGGFAAMEKALSGAKKQKPMKAPPLRKKKALS